MVEVLWRGGIRAVWITIKLNQHGCLWLCAASPAQVFLLSVCRRGCLPCCLCSLQFNQINGLELVCRAHQLVQEGLKYMFPDRNLVTVRSSPVLFPPSLPPSLRSAHPTSLLYFPSFLLLFLPASSLPSLYDPMAPTISPSICSDVRSLAGTGWTQW